MDPRLDRRNFLKGSAAAALAVTVSTPARAQPFTTTLSKALIGKPDEPTLLSMKAAGFDGIESNDRDVEPADAAKARKTAERLGMKIHSLLRGWMNFDSPDRDVVERDLAIVRKALASAAAYGADNILLIPCRVRGLTMPEAWEFDIEFNPSTLHVTRVVRGDNSPYRAYIEAQNRATDCSRAALEKLLPTAEKHGVVIAIENVWNNLWVKPAFARAFIASFDSPWLQSYFDIGNHVKYAPPEEWIGTLDALITKVHVKDFQLNPDGRGGRFVDMREGSVDWPSVRKALDKIGYNGWLTIEGSRDLSAEEKGRRLDLIVAGK